MNFTRSVKRLKQKSTAQTLLARLRGLSESPERYLTLLARLRGLSKSPALYAKTPVQDVAHPCANSDAR